MLVMYAVGFVSVVCCRVSLVMYAVGFVSVLLVISIYMYVVLSGTNARRIRCLYYVSLVTFSS